KQLEYTWLRSLMDRYQDFEQVTLDALRAASRALSLSASHDNEKQLMEAYLVLQPFPEVTQALSQLARRKRAILSNGSPHMLNAAVEHAGLQHLLDAVISVDSLRIFKPHPSVYALVPTRLGVDKEQIGFVSSNYWDVCGAAAFGFNAVWINRAKNPPEELGIAPVATLSTLNDLANVLED
ncbi:MAG TPA: haloacid dehalogenase type II, partial [Burkholderiales bacterium]|nr:haloacid dehalogenase type II [Burkholderiales bacterium]